MLPPHAYDAPLLDLKTLLRFKRIAVQCPDEPDAGSLAVAVALHAYFSGNGKTPLLFYAGEQELDRPNLLEMLERFSLPLRREPSPDVRDGLLIMVNCIPGEGCAERMSSQETIVLSNRLFKGKTPGRSDIRPYLSCCSTLVWQLLEKAQFPIKQGLAAALLYGLYTASNAFSEIRFPLDRDMRDALDYDKPLFDMLRRSNLRLSELTLSLRALHGLECHVDDRCLIVNVLPGQQDVLRFISDLALHVHGVDTVTAFSETGRGIRFSTRSGVKTVKAGELAEWIVDGTLGSGGGTREKGGGFIPADALAEPLNHPEAAHYIRRRIADYTGAYRVIDCMAEMPPAVGTLYAYQKLPVPQAFVKCSTIFPRRKRLCIRMLEGDIELAVSAQIYLMIGYAGEVYPIAKKVFERSYRIVDDPSVMRFPYAPAVIDADSGIRVNLMEHAQSCLSNEGRVLARQLEEGVKLFTRWDRDSYLRGDPGDWLVQRKEDGRDLYIIKEAIFPQLYTKVR